MAKKWQLEVTKEGAINLYWFDSAAVAFKMYHYAVNNGLVAVLSAPEVGGGK